MIRNMWAICNMLFYVFLCNIIKTNHFLYFFITLLHLISSFKLTRPLLVPYAYVSIESIDFILLSSLALNAILLTSSVKREWFLLLNICCAFNSNCFFRNSLWFSQRLFTLTLFFSEWFILFSSGATSKQCL